MTRGLLLLLCAVLGVFALAWAEMPPAQDQMPEQQMMAPESFTPSGPRLALVISQTEYGNGLSRIGQADTEGDLIAEALQATGFVVERRRNLDRPALADALDEFRIEVERAGKDAVAFVYYTGHGAQHPETEDSYLLGVDAKLRVASDLAVYGIDMRSQRDGFAATRAKAVFMVFDACRNTGGLEGFKTSTKGLSRVEANADMLIAYATGLGDVAREGVYAPILAEELTRPGQTAEAAFTNAQRRVAQETEREQLPWTNNLLYNTVCFAGCETSAVPTPATVVAPRQVEPTDPDEYQGAAGAFSAAAMGEDIGRRVFSDCLFCPDMVAIPGGDFTMGAPRNEPGSGLGEQPQRFVTVSRFALSQTEVTWDQWNECVRAGPCDPLPVTEAGGDSGYGLGDRPVIHVSSEDAATYAAWLSEETGRSYRLPSEAEWEYAARAGRQTAYPFGEDPHLLCDHANVEDEAYIGGRTTSSDYAECNDGFGRETAPVAQFASNPFGLYDMHGNVAEWTADCYSPSYKAGQPTDGSAFIAQRCRSKTVRGGSWNEGYEDARSASRTGRVANHRDNWIGFRIARDD